VDEVLCVVVLGGMVGSVAEISAVGREYFTVWVDGSGRNVTVVLEIPRSTPLQEVLPETDLVQSLLREHHSCCGQRYK
jgi:hypothetical protein